MPENREAAIQERFARQAKAFARSPFQRDPERLRRLLRFAAVRPGERAIDVGCGPGIVTAALRAAGVEALGIDLTAEMLREARGAGGPYVRGDVKELPFPDRTFDLAVCRNTVHHLSDPPGVMREMARVLRPAGRVVIEDMRAPDDPARRAYHETIERLRDPAHGRTLTAAELRGLLGGAGLESLREEAIGSVIDAEEWLARGFAAPEARREALRMLEACIAEDRAGLRVWREAGRLVFERQSLLVAGVRPAGP